MVHGVLCFHFFVFGLGFLCVIGKFILNHQRVCS
jgi:hypothetical protein